MGRSIHGVAKDLESLNNLNRILVQEGLSNFDLSYIGGLSVLVTLGTPGMVNDVMSNYSESLSKVFSRFHVRKGEYLPLDRVVYPRISGVPVHLRDSSVYDDIGGLFGKVVQESSFSWVDSDNSECSVLVLVPLGKRIEETVVITWEDRKFVVWVVEDVDAWKPELEEENSVAIMVSNPVGEADGDSVGNNREDQNMEDDVEDGEIRSPEVVIPSPEKVFRPSSDHPSDPPSVSIHEQPLDFEKSDNNVGLHEKYGDVQGECSMPRESKNIYDGIDALAAGNVGGLNRMEERECPFVDQLNQDGPTPLVGLGKRNRDNRSPPSSGSMEGPPNRGFFQHPLGDPPFDLNRPSSPTDSRSQEILGDDRHGESVQDEPVLQSEPDASGPVNPDTVNPIIDSVAEEVLATTSIGSVVGINLQGFKVDTRSLILGEGVYTGIQ
ncbi:hypothetical protein HanIR_Chr08g0371011 [Helianthus annuus]|nr:hypothetical protein HanIR_Chr08g0371011 [Helianthus annuus]